MFKKFGIIAQFLFIFAISSLIFTDPVYALTTGQFTNDTINSTGLNAFYQSVGQGNGVSLDTVTVAVYNNSGGNVSTNASAFKVIEYTTSGLTGTYPCSGTGCTKFSPASITCNPSNRCTGSPISAITSGTEIVYVTATFSSKTFNASRYYILGYEATNSGNRLKPVGASTGSLYYEDSANYGRADVFGSHNSYFINQPTQTKALYYSINGAVATPTVSLTTTETTADFINSQYVVSGSGDFGATGTNYHGQIQYIRACSTGDTTVTLDSETVFIDFYTNNVQTNTVKLDDYHYLGTTFTSTNSGYAYTGVRLPMKNGSNCTYIPTANLWNEADPYNPIAITLTNKGILTEYTPSTASPNTPFTGTDPNSSFCGTFELSCYYSSFLNWVSRFVSNTFGFSPVIPNFKRNLGQLQALFTTKAPFGYFTTAFAISTVAPTVTDPVPDFTYALGAGGYGNLTNITVNFPTGIDTVVNGLRIFINIALYLLLFGYIISVARRINK